MNGEKSIYLLFGPFTFIYMSVFSHFLSRSLSFNKLFVFKIKRMENFPSSFMPKNVISKVNYYRLKKIEDDMKCIRKKIVKSFQGNVNYHSEITHEMLPDLSEEEQKNFYCMIKDELQQRGFIVRGKIQENKLTLIVFSNTPRNIEMDRILKQYSEEFSDTSSNASSEHQVIHPSSVPSSPKSAKSPLITSSKIRKSSTLKSYPNSRSNSTSRSNSRSVSRSSTISRSSTSSKPKTKTERKSSSKIPRLKPITHGNAKEKSNTSQTPKTITPTTPIKHDIIPQDPTSQSNIDSHVLVDQTQTREEVKLVDTIQNPTSSQEFTPQKLNMDFIMEKLKKANRKQNILKR